MLMVKQLLLLMMILKMLKRKREIKETREVAEVVIEVEEAALPVTEKAMNTMTSYLESTSKLNKEKTVTTTTVRRKLQHHSNKTQFYQLKLKPKHSKDGETFNSEKFENHSLIINIKVGLVRVIHKYIKLLYHIKSHTNTKTFPNNLDSFFLFLYY